MKAVVFHDIADIRLDTIEDPRIEERFDAIVRLTASAICGTDLHMVRGTMPGMKPGTVLGHEGVGVVEEVGAGVTNLRRGDRVVIPSTIACGSCSYCRGGYTAQCDIANPNGIQAGTAFFGGPEPSGPFHGLQAQFARIPYANVNLVRLPEELSDDQVIALSDIAPTGWFGADLADIEPGKTVAVWGCGPVGLFAIRAAMHMKAGRVIAVDAKEDRLEMARMLGAETVDFTAADPVEAILDLTRGVGVDRAIEAVGVDGYSPEPPRRDGGLSDENKPIVEGYDKDRDVYIPGDAPSLAATWAMKSLAKAGVLSVIGVFPPEVEQFPFGLIQQRNLTVRSGNANHLKYVKDLVALTRQGSLQPTKILTQNEPMTDVIEAYRQFDARKPGWVKVALEPAA